MSRVLVWQYNRLRSDMITCPIFILAYFALHGTTLFSIYSNAVNLKEVLVAVAVAVGFVLSYVVPKLRAQMPWLCFSQPLIPTYRCVFFSSRVLALLRTSHGIISIMNVIWNFFSIFLEKFFFLNLKKFSKKNFQNFFFFSSEKFCF